MVCVLSVDLVTNHHATVIIPIYINKKKKVATWIEMHKEEFGREDKTKLSVEKYAHGLGLKTQPMPWFTMGVQLGYSFPLATRPLDLVVLGLCL
jgi:mRNA-degrading endonuclease toxin of MazEF toxin-antitoxin module